MQAAIRRKIVQTAWKAKRSDVAVVDLLVVTDLDDHPDREVGRQSHLWIEDGGGSALLLRCGPAEEAQDVGVRLRSSARHSWSRSELLGVVVGGQASEVDAAPGSVAVLGLDEPEVINSRAGRRIVGFRAAGSARWTCAPMVCAMA
jgi:hypothetical protein